MAFNVLLQVGEVPTVKDNETVKVQVVQISTQGGKVMNRVEARLFANNPGGYNGPTKTALVFDDADDIDALIEALTEAKAQAATLGTVNPVAAPVVVKARKPRANAPRAAVKVAV